MSSTALPRAAVVLAAAATLAGGCSSRVERFDYDYGSTHPAYNGYSRLGGPPVHAPTGPARAITVASGDSLFAIARRYGVTVEALRAANRLEGDRLRIGQRLIVPSATR